jgi:hypothetical protein
MIPAGVLQTVAAERVRDMIALADKARAAQTAPPCEARHRQPDQTDGARNSKTQRAVSSLEWRAKSRTSHGTTARGGLEVARGDQVETIVPPLPPDEFPLGGSR